MQFPKKMSKADFNRRFQPMGTVISSPPNVMYVTDQGLEIEINLDPTYNNFIGLPQEGRTQFVYKGGRRGFSA